MIASLDPQPLRLYNKGGDKVVRPVGGNDEGDASLTGGRWQRDTDRHQARVLRLAAASNDHRPSPIRRVREQWQICR